MYTCIYMCVYTHIYEFTRAPVHIFHSCVYKYVYTSTTSTNRRRERDRCDVVALGDPLRDGARALARRPHAQLRQPGIPACCRARASE